MLLFLILIVAIVVGYYVYQRNKYDNNRLWKAIGIFGLIALGGPLIVDQFSPILTGATSWFSDLFGNSEAPADA